MKTDHIVVVGAGAVGLATARSLATAGARVTVLESGEVGHGCSAGNLGWIVPSICLPIAAPGLRAQGLNWLTKPDSPLYIKPSALPGLTPWLTRFWKLCTQEAFDESGRLLMLFGSRSLELHQELVADCYGGIEWRQRGLLIAFRDVQALQEKLSLIAGYDYGPIQRLDADELRDLEPGLASRRFVGGLLIEPEAHVEPLSLTAALARRCRALGVEIREGWRVAALSLESSPRQARALVGETSDGPFEIEADQFVVATGAESGKLARACGTPIPLQAGKGYSITLSEPEIEIQRPVYLAEAKLGLTPFEGLLRIAGTLELSGINREIDRRRLAAIERVAERAVPGSTRGSARREWAGMRPLTPDGLPVIGRLPSAENVWLNTGHQMLGITLAPASGGLLAQLLLGAAETGFDPPSRLLFERGFSPGRFASSG